MTTAQQIGNVAGVTAANANSGAQATNINGGAAQGTAYTDSDLANITTMRARLTAIDGTTYSATNLNKMTYNDMVYAIRLNDAPTTIKA